MLLFTVLPAQAQDLQPFTSDGCSAFPDGTYQQQQLWLKCCVAHDFAYWKGGSFEQRLQADEALRNCVAAVGQPEIAELMLAGVRVGGTPFLPTPFRWGYGWPFPRAYAPLTEPELGKIRQAIEANNDIPFCHPSALTLDCTE